MRSREDFWLPERIAKLTKDEIRILRDNARTRGQKVIEDRCNAALAMHATPRRGGKGKKGKTPPFEIPDGAVAEVAELIRRLPPATEVPFARLRASSLANPVTTFTGLWRHFVSCGFSSQEESDPDTPLGAFLRGGSPLLDLAAVLSHKGTPTWVADELARAGLRRMANRRRDLLVSAYTAFVAARGADDALVNGEPNAPGMRVFIELASGRVSDRDIAQSRAFSASITPGPLYGMGHKQIRNVLVNSGLAHNIVPLDSRWQSFFEGRISFAAYHLGNQARYLALEGVLRDALQLAQDDRTDIPNLAILDAIVFASQSRQGHAVDGWAGS